MPVQEPQTHSEPWCRASSPNDGLAPMLIWEPSGMASPGADPGALLTPSPGAGLRFTVLVWDPRGTANPNADLGSPRGTARAGADPGLPVSRRYPVPVWEHQVHAKPWCWCCSGSPSAGPRAPRRDEPQCFLGWTGVGWDAREPQMSPGCACGSPVAPEAPGAHREHPAPWPGPHHVPVAPLSYMSSEVLIGV